LPAPNHQLFSILNCTNNTILLPFFDSYWLPWSQDYNIMVDGEVWETFIYQEQLSRSTTLHPLSQHNLLNDNHDDDLGDDNDDLGDDNDDLGDDNDDLGDDGGNL
jgi:hypothetical protein